MIVLHLFVPGKKTIRQGATWRRLEQLRRHGRHVVVDWPTVDVMDNAAAIAWCWNRGHDVCVVEQDVEPTLEQLVELERCRMSSVCTLATRRAGDVADEYDFRIRASDGELRWGCDRDRWADLVPLGCTVFRAAVMARVSVPREPWQQLDTMLSLELGVRAHVHWPPAAHHHH